MRTNQLIQLLLVVLALAMAGCTTLSDVRTARGEGRSRIYDESIDTVWNSVPTALRSLGLKVAGENEQERYVLAEKGTTAFSYGENVAVFLYKIDDERTRVEVVSKKAVQTNLLAWDWEKPVLDELSKVLSTNR